MSVKLTKDRLFFEIMLILLALGMTCLLHKLGGYKMVILNLYFLPVVLSGYYLGRTSAGVLALFSALSVSVVTTLDSGGFAAFDSPIMVGLAVTVWASVLGLTALLVGSLCDERAAKVDELQEAYIGVVEVLSKYLQSANPRHKARSVRVAELSQAIATEMKLSPNDCEDIRVAALLHDIGNVEITTKLINRAMDTLEEQPNRGDKHTFLGSDLVHSLGSVLRGAVPLLATQDDGMPGCLVGGQELPSIGAPLGTKVIQAARAYDALVDSNFGVERGKPAEAVAQLRKDRLGNHDPEVLDALERVLHHNDARTADTPTANPAFSG